MSLVNLDMKVHRYVKNVGHNLSMIFNGLVSNNEISKVFTYEWKKPFNDDSGKKTTFGVTCPCCKNNLTLDLQAKPNENQEMKLLVEVKAALEGEPEWNRPVQGLTREMIGYSKEQSLDMEKAWDAAETGEELGEEKEAETSVQKDKTSGEVRTPSSALSLEAPRAT